MTASLVRDATQIFRQQCWLNLPVWNIWPIGHGRDWWYIWWPHFLNATPVHHTTYIHHWIHCTLWPQCVASDVCSVCVCEGRMSFRVFHVNDSICTTKTETHHTHMHCAHTHSHYIDALPMCERGCAAVVGCQQPTNTSVSCGAWFCALLFRNTSTGLNATGRAVCVCVCSREDVSMENVMCMLHVYIHISQHNTRHTRAAGSPERRRFSPQCKQTLPMSIYSPSCIKDACTWRERAPWMNTHI